VGKDSQSCCPIAIRRNKDFESLKAIYAVSPSFVPRPYAWGKYCKADQETYFLLAEFRTVGEQVREYNLTLSGLDIQNPAR